MSKIFEALKNTNGETADAVFPALGGAEETHGNIPPAAPALGARAAIVAQTEPTLTHNGKAPATHEARHDRDLDFQAIRTLPLGVPEQSPVLPFDDTNFKASEQYRIIRTRILQHPSKPCMLVISSPGPGDGKSVTAINLAGALSLKASYKVLLVDADFRRASIHHQLGFPEGSGVADVLEGRCRLEDAVIRTEQFPGLYILPAGTLTGNPAELLDSPQWLALCAKFRKSFEHVIVDSPPVKAVADYDLIQASCDGIILVVRPDHTKRKVCLDVVEKLPKNKLVGVLMNCVSHWFLSKPHSYESYYYRR